MNHHSPSPSPRVARRRQDALERVLGAASLLFARNGFFETSMAAIAREADVSVGTLYNLFDGKDALCRELIDNMAEAFHARLARALERGANALERLDSVLAEKLALISEEAEFIRFYFAASSTPRFSLRTSLPAKAREFYEAGRSKIALVIADGLRAGLFSVTDPYRSALALQATTDELFLAHIDAPERHPAEAMLAEAKTFTRRLLDVRDREEGS